MTDELERIRRYRADEPPPAAGVLAAARAELETAIAAHPRSRRWRLGLTLAAACAAAGAVLAIGTGTSSPTSAVAAVLQRLAHVAERQSPVRAPRHDQYLYVASVQTQESDGIANGQECVTLAPEHRQIWIRADGAGRLLETFGPPTFPTPADRARCARMHATPTAGTSDSWFAPRCLELGLASRLRPGTFENPSTLLAEMRRIDGGPRTAAEDFVHVGDFLRESDASPALRAAIYRAAATIPGVRLLGTTADHLGRRGIGIAFPARGYLSELILDPRTSALLGEQTVSVASGRAGEWAAYRASRIVDRIPARPPAPLGPACVGFGGYVHTFAGGVTITNRTPVRR
jgi:hypothetical protein